jgi:imidazolonepropionase-like amidohydrolase
MSFYHPNHDSLSGVTFSMEELEAFVKTAAQVGKFVTAHSQNRHGSKIAILAGVKTIDHASRSDEEVASLGKIHGAIFVSTLAYLRVMLDGKLSSQASAMIQKEWDVSVEAYRKIHDEGCLPPARASETRRRDGN